MADSVVVHREPPIARLILNRPEVFNAVDLPMTKEFTGCLTTLASDDTIRAIVMSGAGAAFCAGGDLKWILQFASGPAAAFRALASQFHEAILTIRTMGKPVIAAINGIAAGGGFSLALACDFRVMSEEAKLRLAYTSSGLCIDGSGTFTLPRMIGFARALELAALDRPIDARQALDWGLVNEVAPKAECETAALNLANELAARSLQSFAWAKKLLNGSFETNLETQLEKELDGIVACASHADGTEGVRAFVEKRTPRFYEPRHGSP